MTDQAGNPMEKIEAALGAFDHITESPVYSADMVLGAYATVTALTRGAQESGELAFPDRIQVELRAAELAGKIATEKSDPFTAQTMATHGEHCRTILDLLQAPAAKQPAQPAAPTKKTAGKAKQ